MNRATAQGYVRIIAMSRHANLQPWLDGVDFPARPVALLAVALRRPAPDWVIEHLGRLAERTYHDLEDVSAG